MNMATTALIAISGGTATTYTFGASSRPRRYRPYLRRGYPHTVGVRGRRVGLAGAYYRGLFVFPRVGRSVLPAHFTVNVLQQTGAFMIIVAARPIEHARNHAAFALPTPRPFARDRERRERGA